MTLGPLTQQPAALLQAGHGLEPVLDAGQEAADGAPAIVHGRVEREHRARSRWRRSRLRMRRPNLSNHSFCVSSWIGSAPATG